MWHCSLLLGAVILGATCTLINTTTLSLPLLEDLLDIVPGPAAADFSVVDVKSVEGVPDSCGWSLCRNCAYDPSSRNVHLFLNTSNTTLSTRLLLSWSQWGEFFHHHDRADQIWATPDVISPQTPPFVVARRPVFLLPILTLHPGHLYVDLLEQVYNAMHSSYGRCRADSLIVLDVAWPAERAVLQEKIETLMSQESFAIVLTALTKLPVISRSTFDDLLMKRSLSRNETVVFEMLHVGLDNSKTSSALGLKYRPSSLVGSRAEVFRYREMQTWLLDSLNVTSNDNSPSPPPSRMNILLVERAKSRRLAGVEESLTLLAHEHDIAYANLEMPLPQQLELLRRADVLVCAAGTAAHNALFMRPGSGLLLAMQPGWCDQAYTYTAQARLLGVLVEVVCADEAEEEEATAKELHWARRVWQQGPHLSKNSDIVWDARQNNALARLIHRVKRVKAGQADTNVNGCGADDGDDDPPSSQTVDVENEQAPAVQIFVRSASATLVPSTRPGLSPDSIEYTASLQGSLVMSNPQILAAMPRLSVCVQVLPPSSPLQQEPAADSHSCTPLSTMNYLAQILLSVPEDSPAVVLHLWASVSPTGGRIEGSEIIHSLDLRLLLSEESSLEWGGIGVGDASFFEEAQRRQDVILLEVPIIVPSTGGENEVVSGLPNADSRDAVVSFSAPASTARSLQAGFVPWCRGHSPPLPLLLCGDIHLMLTRQIRQARLALQIGLPRPQLTPSPTRPFVFLHVEKTGGTSLRRYLSHAAERLALGSLLPCHGGVHCLDTLSGLGGRRASLTNVSILAGHYSWHVWEQLPSLTQEHPPWVLLMMRHPVDRAVSYYYQRCYQIADCPGYGRPLSTLSAAELEDIVIHDRQGAKVPRPGADHAEEEDEVKVLDEGMSEAHCRALADEKQTTGVAASVLMERGADFSRPLTAEGRTHAIQRARQCLIGSIDRWDDTLLAIRHWLPWLSPSLDALGLVHDMSLFAEIKESRLQLQQSRPDLVEVLERHNSCDMSLYREMAEVFDRQAHFLQDAAYA